MEAKNPKEKYYALDNFRFIGSQEYRSPAQRKEDDRVAAEAFRKHRAESNAHAIAKQKS